MHLGVQLAHLGPLADAAAVRTAATSADVLGYHSLWAVDPFLLPAAPDGQAPAGLDPVAALGYAAACTERVRLGVHLRDRPAEAITAAVAALDALSTERLIVAVDLRSPEATRRGGPEDEPGDDGECDDERRDGQPDLLAALRAPRRPLLVSTRMTPGAASRIARCADGWMAMRLPPGEVDAAWREVLAAAHRQGRDPAELRLVVRVDVTLSERPLGRLRSTYCGSVDQVVDDLVDLAGSGASDAVLALPGEHGLDELLGAYAAIAEGLELRAPS